MRLVPLLPALALAGALTAQEPTPVAADQPQDPAVRIKAIVDAYNAATRAWSDKYQKASADERKQLVGTYPDRTGPVAEVLDLSEANADLDDLEAGLRFALTGSPQQRARALSFVLAHRMERPRELLAAVQSLSRYTFSPAGEAICRKVLARGEEEHALAIRARFHLAQCLSGYLRTARRLADDPAAAENLTRFHGETTMARIKELDRERAGKEFEGLLEAVVAEGKDVSFRRGTYAEAAAGELFEVRNLQVGKVAPEVEGTGIRGKALKLSDFRGKVVLLDFWGDW
ncbi:MAG: hypothetical protein R3F30_08345 [Planctomycetota bacterium]